MKYIWVIEEGMYSNYRVTGVFSSCANAKLVCDKVGGSVSRWPLDPSVDEIRKGYNLFIGEMLYDGTTERMERYKPSGYNLHSRIEVWPRSGAPAYKGKSIKDCLHGAVWAKDMKHAVKIFNEQRIQMIATGKIKP